MDPLLGNDSVNTFPRKRTLATIGHPLLGNRSVNKRIVIGAGIAQSVLRLGYKLDDRGFGVQFPVGARDISLLHKEFVDRNT
jgi:hypothetical protein